MPTKDKAKKALKRTETDIERAGKDVEMKLKRGGEHLKADAKKLRKKI
jgi:hypothetical protein